MTAGAGIHAGDPTEARVGDASPPATAELDCREVVELVTDFLDGALEPPLAAAVERHLASCPLCVEYVRQLRQTTRLLRQLPEEALSERARMEILVAFRGFRRPGPDP